MRKKSHLASQPSNQPASLPVRQSLVQPPQTTHTHKQTYQQIYIPLHQKKKKTGMMVEMVVKIKMMLLTIMVVVMMMAVVAVMAAVVIVVALQVIDRSRVTM